MSIPQRNSFFPHIPRLPFGSLFNLYRYLTFEMKSVDIWLDWVWCDFSFSPLFLCFGAQTVFTERGDVNIWFSNFLFFFFFSFSRSASASSSSVNVFSFFNSFCSCNFGWAAYARAPCDDRRTIVSDCEGVFFSHTNVVSCLGTKRQADEFDGRWWYILWIPSADVSMIRQRKGWVQPCVWVLNDHQRIFIPFNLTINQQLFVFESTYASASP